MGGNTGAIMAIKDLFYDKPLTPTSGRSEKSWFTNLKKSTGQAAAAVTAVSNVGGAIVSKVTPLIGKTATKSKDVYVKKLAEKPLLVGGGTLIAGGYIAANPKGATEELATAPSNLANFGGNLRNLRDNPTKENVQKVFNENPFLAGATTAGIGYGVSRGGLYLYDTLKSGLNDVDTSNYLDTFKKESSNIPQITSLDTTKTKTKTEDILSGVPLSPQSNAVNLPAETTTRSYKNSNSVAKRKHKAKKLNITPINLRNTVNIFNRN